MVVHQNKRLDLMTCTMHVDCGTQGLNILLPIASIGLGGRKFLPFIRGCIVVILSVRRRLIQPKSSCAVRNHHTMATSPFSVSSVKLSIIGISYYYCGRTCWNPECCFFGCLKYQWIWKNNGSLLHFTCLGFRDKQRSSTFTPWRGAG